MVKQKQQIYQVSRDIFTEISAMKIAAVLHLGCLLVFLTNLAQRHQTRLIPGPEIVPNKHITLGIIKMIFQLHLTFDICA